MSMSLSHPHGRKRPSSSSEKQSTRACDQCRNRKVKCDRQQPECSSCRKAGVTCDFSDMLRRVNYAKRLHDEFSSVTARMDKLEAAISKIPEQIVQSLSSLSASNATPMYENTCSRTFLNRAQAMALIPRGAELKNEDNSEKWQPHFERIRIAHGGERIVGYPAALTLFVSIKRHVIKALASTTQEHSPESSSNHSLTKLVRSKPFLQAEFQKQVQSFPFNGVCNDPLIKSDGRSLTTPPRTLLVPALEYFLEHVNSYIPIFNPTALREMVDEHYADMDKNQCAYRPLIINCIILLSLNNSARRNGIKDTHMGTMGEDLIATFRKNCDRALANLFEFTSAGEGNVQALMTLALVARESYGSMAFEKVCQVASQVVRSAGLNLARRPPPVSWEKTNQQEMLFWAMYMLDKQRVFLNGHPCDLYIFDSDLQLASCREDATYQDRMNAATVHLATIWEEIFIALYSCRGARASNMHRSRQAEILRNLVNEWSLQHHSVIDHVSSAEIQPGSEPPQMELKYNYHVTQILINRCDSSENSQDQVIFHARSALKIIELLATSHPLTVKHAVSLERIFRNYPTVAYHDLFAFCLTKGFIGRGDDIHLLRAARDAYQLVHEPNMPGHTPEKLYTGFNWSIGLLNLIDSAHRSHDSAPVAGPQYELETSEIPKTMYQFNVPCQGNNSRSNYVSFDPSLISGFPMDTTLVPTTGTFEGGLIDFDFYQGLFQQEEWDPSTSL